MRPSIYSWFLGCLPKQQKSFHPSFHAPNNPAPPAAAPRARSASNPRSCTARGRCTSGTHAVHVDLRRALIQVSIQLGIALEQSFVSAAQDAKVRAPSPCCCPKQHTCCTAPPGCCTSQSCTSAQLPPRCCRWMQACWRPCCGASSWLPAFDI